MGNVIHIDAFAKARATRELDALLGRDRLPSALGELRKHLDLAAKATIHEGPDAALDAIGAAVLALREVEALAGATTMRGSQ